MRQMERQLRVRELINTEEFLSLDEIAKRLGASRSSVRRDLMELEELGVLRRVHGGAISLSHRDERQNPVPSMVDSSDEKARIGRTAAALVADGQTVILGGGSSVAEVAHSLLNRAIQIITNSIPVAQTFVECRQTEVTLTGGYLYPRTGVQLGPICEQMLRSVSADILIMGIHGITSLGISDTNPLIVESIRAMMKAAAQVVIVADKTKFGRDAMVHVAELAEVDMVVTESGVEPEFVSMLEHSGVRCVLA